MKKPKLKLFNTMGRKLEEFKPLKPPYVGMYTCGPTVYNYAHIGNLRTYIFEDILRRVLEYNGYKVRHVMNITDVGHLTSDADTGEDKVEKAAKEKKMDAWKLAEFYTKAFFEDIAKLNIKKAHIIPKATEHIKEMIELIKKLEEKGYTYRTSDGIYFDTSKLPDYGKLAGLKIEDLKAGARVEMREKKHKTDFALWKFSPKNVKRQMEWDSPWGVGFPGWHIECSAMSMKYLGEQFDIHCGGIDHIPVHHTNEIAQSEAATGKKPWVRYWLHGEFLVLKEGRMGKSKGNIITLRDLEKKGYEPLAFRYLCLTTHYRKPLRFDFVALDKAQKALERMRMLVSELREKKIVDTPKVREYKMKFLETINNDLDMPNALKLAWEVLRSEALSDSEKYTLIKEFDKIFALDLEKEVFLRPEELPEKIRNLLEKREQLRKEKRYEEADKIREELRKQGYEVMDTKEGPKIRKKLQF